MINITENSPENKRSTAKPREYVECKFCGGQVGAGRLKLHMTSRCPKRPPVVVESNHLNNQKKRSPSGLESTRPKVLVRSRLDRLMRDLSPDLSNADDLQVAKLFKAFYIMYMWEGDRTKFAAHRILNHSNDGEASVSIRTVSGGLPSLGKRAK